MRRGLLKCCPVLLQGRQIRGTVPWPPEPSKGRAEGSHPTSCWWRLGLLNLHHRTLFATHLLSPPQFYPEKKVQKSQLNSRLFFFFFFFLIRSLKCFRRTLLMLQGYQKKSSFPAQDLKTAGVFEKSHTEQ